MTPPRLPRAVLRRLAPREVRESLVADLDDVFERQASETTARRARWWYRRQAVRGVPALLSMRLQRRRLPAVPEEKKMTAFDSFQRDLRYAIRWLWRSPAFTVPAALTIALGIGATAAIFSVVHAVLLAPLPYSAPDRLVMVFQDMRARGGPANEWATPGNLADWLAAKDVFSSVASIRQFLPTLTGMGEPEPLVGELVTQQYFDVLGTRMEKGRTFRPEEAVPNAGRVVIISHGAWQRRFGGDPNVIGRRLTLSGEPHEIVGVLPAGFRPVIVSNAEVWRPERFSLTTPSRGAVVLRVVARLAPGLTLASAQTRATALAAVLEQKYPEFNRNVGFGVVPLQDQVVTDVRPGLLVLSAAVLFVLLIAALNVANLLLARGSNRVRELGVRMALGASRGRVVRQLLTESVLLSVIGGALGIGISLLGVEALVGLAPDGSPRLDEVHVNGTVLLFAGAMTIVTGLLFGLVPALQASREGRTTAVNSASRGAVGGPGRWTRRLLVVGEIAVALMLLVGGGLLLRTFVSLQRSDLGFDPTDVTVGLVLPPAVKYPGPPALVAFYDQVLERAQTLPGVRVAALASVLPLAGGDSDMDFHIEGAPPPRTSDEAPVSWYRLVSASYFEALGIKPRRGRLFAAREPTPEVVINEALARNRWPGEDPLGRRVRFGADGPWFTIVGIVGEVKHLGPRAAPRNEIFIPYWQFTERGMNVVLKAAGGAERLVRPLKDAVAQIDKEVPVSAIGPMTQMVADSIQRPRFLATLVVLFAGLAALLSAVGIFGVLSYTVAQRTGEIGVRLALGASPHQVVWLVLGDGLRLAAIGVVIGVGVSLLLTPALGTLLYGVSPADPLTFALMSVVLFAIAGLASAIPARRATRVSPVTALRESADA